jgi:transposase InsO family protein
VAHGIRQILSRPRQVWDNAVVEAFYSTLKVELVHRYVWATRAQGGQAIFDSSRSSTTVSACTRRWRTARRPNMKLVC